MNNISSEFSFKAADDAPVPAYQRIKDHVREQIGRGLWLAGQAIPTEASLAIRFGVSRMTVNRALRELSDEGVVERVQGSGTFVSQPKYQSALLEIKNIATEIQERGHVHRSQLYRLERIRASEGLCQQFQLASGAWVFHSVVVHFENDLPLQVEDRYVNPAVAPDYLSQDFATQTPNAYLMRVAPLQRVQFAIEACLPTPEVRDMLAMSEAEPCLVLHRQTWAYDQAASVAVMWHPASRYQFTGSF